jgi:hypothetical protein
VGKPSVTSAPHGTLLCAAHAQPRRFPACQIHSPLGGTCATATISGLPNSFSFGRHMRNRDDFWTAKFILLWAAHAQPRRFLDCQRHSEVRCARPFDCALNLSTTRPMPLERAIPLPPLRLTFTIPGTWQVDRSRCTTAQPLGFTAATTQCHHVRLIDTRTIHQPAPPRLYSSHSCTPFASRMTLTDLPSPRQVHQFDVL